MRKRALLILFLIVFVDLLGFGIVIPILPYYAETFGASATQLGFLMTAYSLMQFLVSPLWGRMSDRIGRRPVLLFSLLGTGFAMIFLGFAQTLAWLFVGRTLAGICGANISTAYAYVSDVTEEKDRAKGMGIIGAGFGLGFILGPAIGGALSQWGYATPMFAAGGLCLANFAFAWFNLEEPPIDAEARARNRGRKLSVANFKLALADPRTSLAVLLFFLVTFGVAQMETTFAIFMERRFGFDARRAGMLLALSGVIMVIFQGGLIGKLARRFGEPRLIIAGLLIAGFGLLGFALASTLGVLIGALCVMAVGMGSINPSLSSLASKGAKAGERGAVMGIYHSMGSLARVLGPVTAGFLYDHLSMNAPYVGAAALFFACSVLALSRKAALTSR